MYTHLPERRSRPRRWPVSGDTLTGDGLESAHRQVDAFEHQGQLGQCQLLDGRKLKAASLQALVHEPEAILQAHPT
jgi:hypothetical protein